MSSQETVLYEKKGKVAVITLNRPELNLVNGAVVSRVMETLEDAEDDQNIRCLLLAGAGKKAFSAGIDLKHVSSLTGDGQLKFAESTHDLVYRIARFKKPTIAAIHGHAIGMGYMLAVAADIRVVAQDASFKIPEVELGMFPGSGITVLSLKNGFPPSQLLELILTCREFGAVEADKLGLANRIVKPEELEEVALSLAKKISLADSAVAVPIKQLIRDYAAAGFDESQRKETELHFTYMKRRFLGK
ncbi:MAG: enoyl-CoA hydratase/isomerase family protein [Promethearchaeati archaeon SRVP18_Atabeyarchaeia-1]